MPQEIGPEAQLRLDMKRLAITASEIVDLKRLAAKDPAEARWRIEHEAKVQRQWTDDRTAFLLLQVLGPPPKPTSTKGTGTRVVPHGNPGRGVIGEHIG